MSEPPIPAARIVELTLHQFRSHRSTRITTERAVAVLTGPNGSGKTSVLEAISMLGPGRSLRGGAGGRCCASSGPGRLARQRAGRGRRPRTRLGDLLRLRGRRPAPRTGRWRTGVPQRVRRVDSPLLDHSGHGPDLDGPAGVPASAPRSDDRRLLSGPRQDRLRIRARHARTQPPAPRPVAGRPLARRSGSPHGRERSRDVRTAHQGVGARPWRQRLRRIAVSGTDSRYSRAGWASRGRQGFATSYTVQ